MSTEKKDERAASIDRAKGRLAELAVHKKYLSKEVARETLAVQKALARLGYALRTGEFLILRKSLDRGRLAGLLVAQNRLRGGTGEEVDTSVDLVELSGEEDMRLLARAGEEGAFRAEERAACEAVREALARHGIERRTGEIAIEMGYLSSGLAAELSPEAPPEELPEALRFRRQNLFGHLAAVAGLVTTEQVRECTDLQARLSELGIAIRLSDLLVEKEFLGREDAKKVLHAQKKRLRAFDWEPLAGAVPLKESEETAARALVERGVLRPEEALECRAVLGVLRGLAIRRDLGQVVWEKGYADPVELRRVWYEATGSELLPPPSRILEGAGSRAKRARGEDPWRLGQLAIYNGLLSKEQLDRCLIVQKDLSRRGYPAKLGKILVERRHANRMTVSALLRGQAEHRGLAADQVNDSVEVVKLVREEHEALLARVEEEGLVEPDKLATCREIQSAWWDHRIDKPLGELLVEKGFLSESVMEEILGRIRAGHEKLAAVVRGGQGPDANREVAGDSILARGIRAVRRFRLGRLAQQEGLATKEQVRDALRTQVRLRELGIVLRVGEALIDRGVLTTADVSRLLRVQKERRGAIDWRSLAGSASVSAADAALARILVAGGILDQGELDECRYVRRAIAELGLERDLARVIWEKGFLEREIVERIGEEHRQAVSAPAEDGLEQMGFTLKSAALEKAYEEILAEMEEDSGEPELPREDGIVVQRRALALPIRTTAAPPSRAPWLVLGGVAALALVVAGFVFVPGWLQAKPLPKKEEPPPPEGPATGGTTVVEQGTGGPLAGENGGRPDPGPAPAENPRAFLAPALEALAGSARPMAASVLPEPRRPGRIHLLVAGKLGHAEGTTYQVELADESGTPLALVVAVGRADGSFATSFGPFRSPDSTSPDDGPWLLAGTYRASVRILSPEGAVDGPSIGTLVPPGGAEAIRARQEETIRRDLVGVLGILASLHGKGTEVLRRLATAREGTDPSADRAFAGRWQEELERTRASFAAYRAGVAGDVTGGLLGRTERALSMLAELGRLLADVARDPRSGTGSLARLDAELLRALGELEILLRE
ncbi:MAG: hypothetical protein HY720_20480 [Planctomycetes bacterium]|nr:hypothetical protein [Planctomycetota bacterium]